MSNPASGGCGPESESADSVLYEFTDVVVALPPGTPAPPRPGRLTRDQIDEMRKQGTGESQLQEFTDPATDEEDDEPGARA